MKVYVVQLGIIQDRSSREVYLPERRLKESLLPLYLRPRSLTFSKRLYAAFPTTFGL